MFLSVPVLADLIAIVSDGNTWPALEHGVRRYFLGRCHGVVIPTGSNDCVAAHFSAQAMREM
jgi:hypothetical protein